jgi:dihydroorotase
MAGATRSALTDEFWRGYRDAAGLQHDDYGVVAFGDGPDMATELAELTVAGIKRATAGLVRQFGPDGEPPPVVGGYVVLLDGESRPRAIWRTTEVRTGPLNSVDEGANSRRLRGRAEGIGVKGPAETGLSGAKLANWVSSTLAAQKGAVIAPVSSSSACSICPTDVLPLLPSQSHSEITMAFDLVLRGGRVIDPSQKLDAVTDVAFAAGKVVMVGNELKVDPGTDVRDVSGSIVTPGLIDLHTHVYWGGTSIGIDAEEFCRTSGVTTAVDTGSAGPGNFAGFRKHVIEPSQVRILAYLHVSHAGIFGFSHRVMVGESEEIRLMNPIDAVQVAEANRDLIVGIKVRVGRNSSGTSGIVPLEIALEVAEEVGMPLMAHIDHPPPSYEEVVARLRPGDVLTHAFRPFPNSPATAQGTVKKVVLEARERGVLFDIGHGKGSFAFKTARAMLANGFYPDTISSDVHVLCIDGPAFDQVTTMSKFLCMGMPLPDVIAASTVNAATALRRFELGSLKPGSVGDATIISIKQGQFDYVDVVGEHLIGDRKIVSEGVVIGGRWWHPNRSSKFERLAG